MSATGRAEVRIALDVYPTPAWCVERLLDVAPLPGGVWCDPWAGDGAILRAVRTVRSDVSWHALELRGDCRDSLRLTGAEVTIGDALATPWQHDGERIALVITNPPYALAEAFLARALEVADRVALLLRLDFLGSERRSGFLRRCPPDVHVLPNRPSFVRGKTDSCEYAWFVWHPGRERPFGRVSVLATTPRSVRIPPLLPTRWKPRA